MKRTRLSCASFCKRTYTMFEKTFNNYSYVGYGQCGIIGKNKRPRHTYNQQELRKYLIRYQWAYQKGYYLPKLPESLYDIFYEIKGIFNVATAPISEMLRVSRWLRRATYESSSYYQERQESKRNTVRRNRRK